ncbi:MAG: hypothetical protein KGJ23_04060 [Euryarchaeota archaeon]|nr:hypothetical protein [Euryarchaeota archaeon]MDE1835773.1 hypothetical protein [Euryarchaeota archaeon]MDE1881548.1 hypothetical protein [Euryarchaeota archaeon]MDE2043964.1 hypothetical protein [Thermoplasmata archaeon]
MSATEVFVHSLGETFPTFPREETPAPSFRPLLADELAHQGREVLFLSDPSTPAPAEEDLELVKIVPPNRIWRGRPLGRVARAARRGLKTLLRSKDGARTVLGVMCLPTEVSNLMLRASRNGRRYALMVEGAWRADADTTLALEGLSALAERTGTQLVLVPG